MTTELRGRIVAFLASQLPHIQVKGEELLFPGEEMSSIDLVEMAVELEHEFGVKFRLADITEKNFRSLGAVCELVAAAGKR